MADLTTKSKGSFPRGIWNGWHAYDHLLILALTRPDLATIYPRLTFIEQVYRSATNNAFISQKWKCAPGKR